MRTVRDRLLEGGAQGAAALLSASHHKLSHNLSRFFGHVASMTFLAKSWAESPPQLPSITHSLPPRDFWLLHSLQFFVDLLSGVVVPAPPGDTSLGANFRVKPTKSGALGDLFGLSKWIGDELDEWIVSAIDYLRRLVLTGLGWLDDGLERATVYKLFEYIIRYLPLLLPQAHSPRAAELDRQFLAGLMIFVNELATSEVGEYREMVAYILREVLTSGPHRKMLEPLVTVPMIQPPGRGKKETEKVGTSISSLSVVSSVQYAAHRYQGDFVLLIMAAFSRVLGGAAEPAELQQQERRGLRPGAAHQREQAVLPAQHAQPPAPTQRPQPAAAPRLRLYGVQQLDLRPG